MAVKIRLARKGRKKLALYDVVVADARTPRDGRFIEKLGTYNPNTNPADININADRALDWLMKGAQPTDSVRTMLSYRGVLLRKHLQVGVNKGAITQEQADSKFSAWLKEKEVRIQEKVDNLAGKKSDQDKARLDAETKVKEARLVNIQLKKDQAIERLTAEINRKDTDEADQGVAEVTEQIEVAEGAEGADNAPQAAPEASVEDQPEAANDEKAETPVAEEISASAGTEVPSEAVVDAEAVTEAASEEVATEEAVTEAASEEVVTEEATKDAEPAAQEETEEPAKEEVEALDTAAEPAEEPTVADEAPQTEDSAEITEDSAEEVTEIEAAAEDEAKPAEDEKAEEDPAPEKS